SFPKLCISPGSRVQAASTDASQPASGTEHSQPRCRQRDSPRSSPDTSTSRSTSSTEEDSTGPVLQATTLQSRICPAGWSSTQPSTETSAGEKVMYPATRLASRCLCSLHSPCDCGRESAPGSILTPLLPALFHGPFNTCGL